MYDIIIQASESQVQGGFAVTVGFVWKWPVQLAVWNETSSLVMRVVLTPFEL
jgi:hypothetical protein